MPDFYNLLVKIAFVETIVILLGLILFYYFILVPKNTFHGKITVTVSLTAYCFVLNGPLNAERFWLSYSIC